MGNFHSSRGSQGDICAHAWVVMAKAIVASGPERSLRRLLGFEFALFPPKPALSFDSLCSDVEKR